MEKIKNIGLVLEGGGFRGIHSAGVLDYFLEQGWELPYIIGVSMGSCNGANYIAKQKGRSIEIPYEYINDRHYISFWNLVTKGSLFDMDFVFYEEPSKRYPFDKETFRKSSQVFLICAMDVLEGKSTYFKASELNDLELYNALKASCSLPFISKMVTLRGRQYLDGGLSDSIPVKKAIDDGMEKVLVVATRDKNYRKEKSVFAKKSLMYRHYPKVVDAINNRNDHYNDELDYMKKMEEKGVVKVIYPKEPLLLGRTEKNAHKLLETYNKGYDRAKELHKEIENFISY